jgi:hypothetical protein
MKENVERCSICKNEDCDGREWFFELNNGERRTVCSSQTHVNNEVRYFRYVMGHGNEWDVEVEERDGRQDLRHPIQPAGLDPTGFLRFKENKIVRKLLDEGSFDLNDIGCWDVPRGDRVQFAQLIGYSLRGFGELSYVSNRDYDSAEEMHENGTNEKDARIAQLEKLVDSLKSQLAEPIGELYGMHPDDLRERA